MCFGVVVNTKWFQPLLFFLKTNLHYRCMKVIFFQVGYRKAEVRQYHCLQLTVYYNTLLEWFHKPSPIPSNAPAVLDALTVIGDIEPSEGLNQHSFAAQLQ